MIGHAEYYGIYRPYKKNQKEVIIIGALFPTINAKMGEEAFNESYSNSIKALFLINFISCHFLDF